MKVLLSCLSLVFLGVVNANASVVIDGQNNIAWSDVLEMASNTDKIVIKNSVVNMRNVNDVISRPVELLGENKFIFDSYKLSNDGMFMSNVTGTGVVRVMYDNPDKLYSYKTSIQDNKLYVRALRETEYAKIFNDNVGTFLDKLRMNNDGVSLLRKLDAAPDVRTVHKIMSNSARFSADALMRPVKIHDAIHAIDSVTHGRGIEFRTGLMFGDTIYGHNIGLKILGQVNDRLDVNLKVGASRAEYNNDIDVFNVDIYYVGLMTEYRLSDVVLDFNTGINYAKTDIGYVLYNGSEIKNPQMFSGFAFLDIGKDIQISSNLYVMPQVGFGINTYKTDDYNTNDYIARVGLRAGYAYKILGIQYNYDGRLMVNSDDTVTMGIRAGFLSVLDGMGGHVDISAVHMFDTITYQISVGGRWVF